MAKATFVKSAQKDIYTNGKTVKYVSAKGKREGQTISKIDRTIPRDENDTVFIAKGESYYWWQFKNSPKQLSKTQPKASQLTQSNYLSQLYELQEQIDYFSPSEVEEVESFVEEMKENLENLKDETQGSLDNMPESLQSSPTGELLQERVDALDNAISEFEGIDIDYEEPDEDEIRQDIATDEDIELEEVTQEQIQNVIDEKLQEWLDEKTSEIQGISLEG